MKGYECEECETELHYEQIYGMRIKRLEKDGTAKYTAYCPKCDIYFKTDK